MKTADRGPKDWLEKTLVDQPEVRAAFVDEAVNLYKSGDIGQGTLLQLMRTAIAAQDEADRD